VLSFLTVFQKRKKIIQRIKDLPVSRNTVKDKILKMKTNTVDQLTKDSGSYKFLSICLDESNDFTSSARLAVIAQFCSGDEIREKLVNLATLLENTTGTEICKAVANKITNKLDLSKIVSVTTDGAPSMVGREAGFVTLFTKYVGHPLLGFHCIAHEEALCAKAGLKELEVVMKIVTKVDNFISVRALKKKVSEFAERGEFGVQRTTYVQKCSMA
jgi:hypothetical protein